MRGAAGAAGAGAPAAPTVAPLESRISGDLAAPYATACSSRAP